MAKTTAPPGPTHTRVSAYPIVAIGASAGGLEALRQLFDAIPGDTGIAFIVIQHLDPSRPSMLTNVLATNVCIPIVEVEHGMRAEPNRVHVLPPGRDLSIEDGVLALVPRADGRGRHRPIDTFFRSLAEDQSTRAIGVVLSGSASDGTDGLRAIKAAEGIAFVQDPDSAQFRTMPGSAIAAGVVDFRLPPAQIAAELTRLSHHSYLAPTTNAATKGSERAADPEASLSILLTAVRQHAQLDFRGYKRPTIMRRIARRMALRRFASLADYADFVRSNAGEGIALAQDMLIHVTAFFRDTAAFEALAEHAIPELLKQKRGTREATLRIWAPGCSSGEEVYSLGICVLEQLTERDRDISIKIFGSDVSEVAIESARAGVYRESDVEGVSARRLARFFDQTEGIYRIGKQVRDLCVFVRHDLAQDPPFAKLDLISCRNLLIYFGTEQQRRIFPLLHHSLNEQGYLFLGASEALGTFSNLFSPIDKAHRVFRKTYRSRGFELQLSLGHPAESGVPRIQPGQRARPAGDAQRHADHILLARYAPPGVVVDERLQVVQFRGHTGDFLEQPPGQPQMNLLKLARAGLIPALSDAMETAKARSLTARKLGVRMAPKPGATARTIDLEVIPLFGSGATTNRHFLVLFLESVPRAGAEPPPAGAPADDEAPQWRADLIATQNYLQAIKGEHQDTEQELAAANEELQNTNEELQSTNDELQSAKEELQSTNEELTTINDELRSSNQQLDVVANDLVSVLESVEIPLIMVDDKLRIRRFTRAAQTIASLLPGDLGRCIDDVKLKIDLPDLTDKLRETIATRGSAEWEVQSAAGRWFRLNVRLCRTADDRHDGAILSFLDVDALKHAVQDAELARDYAERIVATVPIGLLIINSSRRVVSANPPFYRSFAGSADAIEGHEVYELASGCWNVPALRVAIDTSLGEDVPFHGLELPWNAPDGSRRELLVAGSPVHGADHEPLLLLAIEDVTESHLLQASEQRARLEAEETNRAKDLFLATLSHELRTPLSTIMMSSQVLLSTTTGDPKVQRASAAIERAVACQARLIDDLLDVSRIVSGKLLLELQSVDLATVVCNAADVARSTAEAKGIKLEVTVHDLPGPVRGDATRLQQVVANLIDNAIKFTPRGGEISVVLAPADQHALITVIDNGIGMRPELVPHLFDRFVQAENSMTRAYGGLGLGLAIVHHLVELHAGEVTAESPGEGMGATIRVTLPLVMQSAASPPTNSESVPRTIRGIRVLLIEDDNDTREACSAVLQGLGAEVRGATSSAEGLTAVGEFRPQVILCDIAMPDQDGYDFVRELRSRPDHHGGRTPAAALTALAASEDRKRSLDAGFQLHLAKPLDGTSLAIAVGDLALQCPPE